VMVTPFRDQLPASLPEGAAHFEFLPFGSAFPRCAAVVHHGGIGTCAQGMAAGVPQLITALAHDQPDNGWRLRQLGVGDYVYAPPIQPRTLEERLRHLLSTSSVMEACRKVQHFMADQMPQEKVAELLEGFARERLRV
ncbi:MAG TPA: nucleotide disphospho-sugar-binding domain-containing protein, partial [Clostridia bacterium]|nr:nucleotide disphospho-sugar-binding domain-containing protein [Clostridia bacterium]